MTVLHAAVRHNPPLDIVQEMIRLCPDMAMARDCLDRTPLHVAAGSKVSASLVKMIAHAHPAACVVQDEQGKTPLHFACDSECVLFEDQSEASITTRNRPSYDAVKILLSYSLHAATLEDDEEKSPLEHAIMSDASLKTVKLLQSATRRAAKKLNRSSELASEATLIYDGPVPTHRDSFVRSRPRKQRRKVSL